jgi:diacylglycerol O-acyltransferase / trehalose O-mycolyltransferase
MLLMTALALVTNTQARAVPPSSVETGAQITGVEQVTDRWQKISVYSPAMDKVIVNDVLRAPGNAKAPIFYLLNGADGGEDNQGWFGLTDIPGFFGEKRVNVVSPIGGRSSYYTDWIADDPALGRNKWQTYLTQELPPLMNRELNSNGLNAIGGLSMSGGAAIDLAIPAPGLYKAVGSYSGCPATSVGKQYTQTVLTVLGGGGNATNMWGPEGSPEWTAHDPSLNPGSSRVSLCMRPLRRGEWVRSTICHPISRHRRAACWWRASRSTAPSSSPMLRRLRAYRSRSSCGPRVRIPGACSTRRCASPGTS